MEKVVRKFESWQAADEADLEYYAQLSGDEKLQILLELIASTNPQEAIINAWCAFIRSAAKNSLRFLN